SSSLSLLVLLLSLPPHRSPLFPYTTLFRSQEVIAKPCPQYVFLNDQDYAYGRFLLDERSRQAVVERLGGVSDVFERTLLWGSLWDAIREADLAPRDFVELALRLLPNETDEALAQNLIGHVTIGLHR